MRYRIKRKIIAGVLAMFLTMAPLQIYATEVVGQETNEEIITSETNYEDNSGIGIVQNLDEEIGATDGAEKAVETKTETELSNEGDVEKQEITELDLGDYQSKMIIGEKQLLYVTALPQETEGVSFSYTSSDTNVATINGMGRITALAVGKTTITVSAGGVSQAFELNVVEEENTNIAVKDIEIAEHENGVEVGKTISLTGTILPSDATDANITYRSSNTDIATVNSSGEVKGISKGEVTITLSAGEITKEVRLVVKVATARIDLNEEYLVLKTGETFQLSGEVVPDEADQSLTYRSADSSIATVSQTGFVTAKETGTTTIIVSNGDTTVAVSVIVNETSLHQEIENEEIENNITEDIVYENVVYASDCKVVDSEMLSYIYENKQILKIIGVDYTIEIDGKDIVNYNNEFYTDISLENENGTLSFVLNQGKELCGSVTLYLDVPTGKHLYLYNESKEKYEKLAIQNVKELKLSTAGEYLLRETKLQSDSKILLYGGASGIFVMLTGTIVFILTKRKYWFW